MKEKIYDMGVVGLGVMGRNLALNIAEHGFRVAVYNRTAQKTERFMAEEASGLNICAGYTFADLANLLRKPRIILTMVKSGPPVDAVIEGLLPYLEPGDLIIDGGNSHFHDTNRRGDMLAQKNVLYLGVGVSGGENGARYGPSLMPGGPKEAYERVRPIFEAIAAKVNGEPCVTYLGPGSAGHYVKMVHNGIEYGLLELIAETYDVMKRGLGLGNDKLAEIYGNWNQTELGSFLLEITAQIFQKKDEVTGGYLIDKILDAAKQKGTGKWVSEDAMELQVPTPTIDMAVSMRNLSMYKGERKSLSKVLSGPSYRIPEEPKVLIEQLRQALYLGMILVFDQGFSLLRNASENYGYHLPLSDIARIWRGGCIIRTELLKEIHHALSINPDSSHLIMSENFAHFFKNQQDSLRRVVSLTAKAGIPLLALTSALGYFDAYRSDWLPANLIQAQRDCFGSHTYERIDSQGAFHTKWNPE